MSEAAPIPPEPGAAARDLGASTLDECAVKVKSEQRECLICAARIDDVFFDVYWTETRGGRVPLLAYICRVAQVRLNGGNEAACNMACGVCVELVNVLERAELEFLRLRDSFTAAVSENPAFESIDVNQKELMVELVKEERAEQRRRRNSDDEPLSTKKKRGRKPTRRRRVVAELTEVTLEATAENAESPVTVQVKEENSQREQSPLLEEPLLSAEDSDWNIDEAHEPEEDVYKPKTKKIRSKRKSTLPENGMRSRQSGPKPRTKRVTIPIEVPPHLIVKDFEEVNEWESMTGKVNDHPTSDIKKRKRPKSQPKVIYPCKECKAKFNSLARLAFHMVKHDGNKAPYICEVCGAKYKHKKACDIHVAMHKGISDWKCEECNKLFPSKGALHRHNAIHTGKTNYQCDLCGKSFIHTSSFKMHKLAHTGLKPHSCDTCGLALMTRSHLKRHKRIHTGEKRHECTSCGKKFSERYNLLAHHKSHEPGWEPPSATKRVWNGFRCHLCDHRFHRRYMLERHMEVIHERILEKGPPKPRNTMTKLLKAQAAAGSASAKDSPPPPPPRSGPSPHTPPPNNEGDAQLNPLDTAEGGADLKPPLETPEPEVKEMRSAAAQKSSSEQTSAAAARLSNAAEFVNGAWAAPTYLSGDYVLRGADYPQ